MSTYLQTHEYLPTALELTISANIALETLISDIKERTVIITEDRRALIRACQWLDKAHSLIDAKYPETDSMTQIYDDTLELLELAKGRIALMVDFIRPFRLKHTPIDPVLTVQFIQSDAVPIQAVIGKIKNIIELSGGGELMSTPTQCTPSTQLKTPVSVRTSVRTNQVRTFKSSVLGANKTPIQCAPIYAANDTPSKNPINTAYLIDNNNKTKQAISDYSSPVHPHGELALTGYQSNGTQSAPIAAFLCVSFGIRLPMVKLERDTFACAGIRLNQSVNPFQLCHPHMTVNGKASLKSNGAHTCA